MKTFSTIATVIAVLAIFSIQSSNAVPIWPGSPLLGQELLLPSYSKLGWNPSCWSPLSSLALAQSAILPSRSHLDPVVTTNPKFVPVQNTAQIISPISAYQTLC